MSKPDRVGAAVTGRQKGIDYRLFLRRLRPELADKILGQGIVRAGVLRRQPGTSRQDAEEQAKDEMMVQYGQPAECAAALRRLEKRSPLPDQSHEPGRVVCCSGQVPGIHDDDGGNPRCGVRIEMQTPVLRRIQGRHDRFAAHQVPCIRR